MAWIYNVTLTSLRKNNDYAFDARYAGAAGYKSDPAQECVLNKGPLPGGKYRIVGVPFTHQTAGAYTLRLEPDNANNMCGRSGFLIHGDSIKNLGNASQGCIVLDRVYRVRIWESGDREVIVE